MNEVLDHDVRPIELVDAVAEEFHVSRSAIVAGKRQSRTVETARHVVRYLAHMRLGLSLIETAQLVGNREHTGAMWAVREVKRRVSTDPTFGARIARAFEVARKAAFQRLYPSRDIVLQPVFGVYGARCGT